MAWYYKHWTVISGLILVGPLAFPLLWKSPYFTRGWKIILTIIFSILTVVMIYASMETVKIMFDFFKRFQEATAIS